MQVSVCMCIELPISLLTWRVRVVNLSCTHMGLDGTPKDPQDRNQALSSIHRSQLSFLCCSQNRKVTRECGLWSRIKSDNAFIPAGWNVDNVGQSFGRLIGP